MPLAALAFLTAGIILVIHAAAHVPSLQATLLAVGICLILAALVSLVPVIRQP